MNYAFIVITACVVSIDAFIGGFALSLKNKLTFLKTLLIGLITFIMCLPGAFLGELLSNVFTGHIELIGGAIFVAVGIANILSFKKELGKKEFETLIGQEEADSSKESKSEKSGWTEAFLVGLAVGFDAAVANLSVSMMGNPSVLICVIFALAHIIFVGAANLVTKLKIIDYLKKAFWLPGVIMILLAVYKIVSFLIT